MSTPTVSLVVPTRGGRQRLPLLLDSLRAQTDPDFEVVVVVDGDVDDTASLLEQTTDLPLQHVVFPQNRGRVHALNEGFEHARGEVLVRCDDDLVPSPSYVADHRRPHEQASVGVIGIYRNVRPDNAYARAYGHAADRDLLLLAETLRHDAWRLWAGNVSVSRDTWERVGRYDPAFRHYGWEDVDWGYRLHRLGLPIHIRAELTTEHRIAATTTDGRAVRALHSGAARRRFDAIHPDSGLDPVPPARPGTWDRLVDAVARRADERRLIAWGRLLDSRLDALPRPVARKSVALLVEAAFLAGYRDPRMIASAI